MTEIVLQVGRELGGRGYDGLGSMRPVTAARTPRRRTLRGRGRAGCVRRWPRASIDASAAGAAPPARASQRREPGRRREKRVGDAFVLLRLARAGGVDEAAARRDRLRGVPQHRRAPRRRAPARSASRRRQRMSGSRRSVPRPEQGASTSTQSNGARERQRLQQIRLHEPDVRRAAGRHRPPQQLDAAVAHIAGDEQPAAVHRRRERRRLAARRRAGVEHARPGRSPASSATSCDASSCTTNQPCSRGRRRAADGPRRRPAPSGANAAGWTWISSAASRVDQLVAASSAGGSRAASAAPARC